jgi:hypothetical protein
MISIQLHSIGISKWEGKFPFDPVFVNQTLVRIKKLSHNLLLHVRKTVLKGEIS